MNNLLVLLILISLCAVVLMLFTWHHSALHRWLIVASMGGLMLVAALLFVEVNTVGIQAVQVGNWPAPFGITLVADLLSAIMVLLIGVIGAAVAIYGLATVDRERQQNGYHTATAAQLFDPTVYIEVVLGAEAQLAARQ